MQILDEARRDRPGEYLPATKLVELEKIDHLMAARVRAARVAQEHEPAIIKTTVDVILKKFDFSKAASYQGKCYRDVGLVYQYCVFAMLCDDMALLENKLLHWLRTILQSQSFPEGKESIRSTYALLLKESERRIPPQDFRLLEPYLARAASILPS
jgi:hypothetical protein